MAAVPPDAWSDPTPCADWSVRELVNHVTYENKWAIPLFAGSSIEDVGDQFEGDLLGDDPAAASLAAAEDAVTAAATRIPQGGTVALSFGDTPVDEYVTQIAADHLVHGLGPRRRDRRRPAVRPGGGGGDRHLVRGSGGPLSRCRGDRAGG